MAVTRLLRIERTVASLDAACGFYCDALGFTQGRIAEKVVKGRVMRTALLRLGQQDIALTEATPPGAPYPVDSTATDLWFQHFAIVTNDMPGAYARLARHAHTPITRDGPQLLPPDSGGVTAYKFRDPDGHPLELIAFPSDTVPPAWRNKTDGALTLGIDHTAISVGDVAASIAFYRDTLGLRLATRQVNHGPAQGLLDRLDDPVVAVVGLTPVIAATPHVELLAYQRLRGRQIATPLQPWDIAGDRLVFAVDNLPALHARLPAAASLMRDPDGHLLQFEAGNA